MLNELDEIGVSSLLAGVRNGDENAFGRLIEQIYDELRVIARSQRRNLGAADTMNTTALVHEAYAKMADGAKKSGQRTFQSRAHFFRVASRVMRSIITDYARAQSAQKRGGQSRPLSLEKLRPSQLASRDADPIVILSVHAALGDLEELNEDAAKVAELRYFAGLTINETAEALGMSAATAKRRWTVARAWLYRRLSDQ